MKLTKKTLHEAACHVSDRAARHPLYPAYSCSSILKAAGNIAYDQMDAYLRAYAELSSECGVPYCVKRTGFVPVKAFDQTPRGRHRTRQEANELRFTYLLLLAEAA